MANKTVVHRIFRLIRCPKRLISTILTKFFAKQLNDSTYLKLYFEKCMGKTLDLDNPKSFNEKLQWLKLYNRNIEYTKYVDKYEAKEVVGSIIGTEYIIPTLGIYEKFEDIDFCSLPEQFVLKCTHDSGGIVVCKDKSKLNIREARAILSKGLKRNYYYQNREWYYKNVHPRIIAEKYMEDADTKELRDYKFFCFNGLIKFLYVASDRMKNGEETKFDFFDDQFNHLSVLNGHPNAKILPTRPKSFELMKKLASKLSEGIPHVRVDFYEVNGRIYFGEMTFFHFSGVVPFEPEEWDYKFGNYITLPQILQNN